jgi:hypothetical protein
MSENRPNYIGCYSAQHGAQISQRTAADVVARGSTVHMRMMSPSTGRAVLPEVSVRGDHEAKLMDREPAPENITLNWGSQGGYTVAETQEFRSLLLAAHEVASLAQQIARGPSREDLLEALYRLSQDYLSGKLPEDGYKKAAGEIIQTMAKS